MTEIPSSSNTTRRSRSIYSTDRDFESVSSLSCRICLHNHRREGDQHIAPCRCNVHRECLDDWRSVGIQDFSSEGYIYGKDDRRLDDCWRYYLVSGKRALSDANLNQQKWQKSQAAPTPPAVPTLSTVVSGIWSQLRRFLAVSAFTITPEKATNS
nr:3-oxoacyl-(acyl-carrier-protein) synthase [Ipomoea batatas]